MKTIKYIFLSCIFILLPGITAAGENIKNVKVRKQGDLVEVTFDFEAKAIKSNYKTTLTPYIFNLEGEEVAELEQISVSGRKKQLSDSRFGTLGHNTHVVSTKVPRVIRYTATLPFNEWMQYVSVFIDKKEEGCCNVKYKGRQVIGDRFLLYYHPEAKYDSTKLEYELTELEKYDMENPFLHPMEDYGNRYDILFKDRDKGVSTIYFKVAHSDIDSKFHRNREVLDAIAKAFSLIHNDPNASLTYIMVAGYASPEGNLAFNTKLAQKRAESVKAYIKSHLPGISDSVFELYNGREDWEGLREKVENSYMAEKEEILSIIDGYTIEQEERKVKLKNLGEPYRYMLEHFYPPLRNAGYVQVYYEIDRTATVATAVSDDQGRSTWVDPDSPRNKDITAINKAIDLLLDENPQEALTVLQTVTSHPKSYNLTGVCHMLQGDYDAAEVFLLKAIEAGDPYAAENLEEINRAREVFK